MSYMKFARLYTLFYFLKLFKDVKNAVVNTVDIFNAATDQWSNSSLSVARGSFAATSLPNLGVAIFAGGISGAWLKVHSSGCRLPCKTIGILHVVKCFTLCMLSFLMHFTANGLSDVVDIYNAISGTWSTAVLSVARPLLAATSLPSFGVAIFAGGGSKFYDAFVFPDYMMPYVFLCTK